MQGKRADRVSHLIQMELSDLILRRLKDPRLGFVTVTHVDITADLKSARVFYSVMGSDKVKADSHAALEHATGFLQSKVGAVLQLRYTPRLTFIVDNSLDRGMEIDRVLRDIHKEKS